jgi:hypothetical protein
VIPADMVMFELVIALGIERDKMYDMQKMKKDLTQSSAMRYYLLAQVSHRHAATTSLRAKTRATSYNKFPKRSGDSKQSLGSSVSTTVLTVHQFLEICKGADVDAQPVSDGQQNPKP